MSTVAGPTERVSDWIEQKYRISVPCSFCRLLTFPLIGTRGRVVEEGGDSGRLYE